MKGYCENPVCPGPGGLLALHHVVYRQHVRAEGGDQWDPANAMTLCTACHLGHHQRNRILPANYLPKSALRFAVELLGEGAAFEYFRRRYGVSTTLERAA